MHNLFTNASTTTLFTSKTVQNELLQDILTLPKIKLSKKLMHHLSGPSWQTRKLTKQIMSSFPYVGQEFVIRMDPAALTDAFTELKDVDEEENHGFQVKTSLR